MNISIPPDLEKIVSEKIESGQYASPSEVVGEGLRLLEERDRAFDLGLEDLQAKIAVGLEQARRGELLDGEEIFEELEKRAQAQMKSRE